MVDEKKKTKNKYISNPKTLTVKHWIHYPFICCCFSMNHKSQTNKYTSIASLKNHNFVSSFNQCAVIYTQLDMFAICLALFFLKLPITLHDDFAIWIIGEQKLYRHKLWPITDSNYVRARVHRFDNVWEKLPWRTYVARMCFGHCSLSTQQISKRFRRIWC